MKENPERMFGQKQERLTSKPRNLTLRSEGIPMAEQQEVQAPKTPESTPTTKTISPKDAWQDWIKQQEENLGRSLSKDEKRVIDMSIDMDIEPKLIDKEETWESNRLRDLVLQFNEGFIGREGKPTPIFISNHVARVNAAVKTGEISQEEANRFLGNLDNLLLEAQNRETERVKELAKGYAKEQSLDWDTLPLPYRDYLEEYAKKLGPSLGAMTAPPAPPAPPPGAPPPGGGGTPPPGGGVPPGGPGGPFVSREFLMMQEIARLKTELRVALGLDPTHPLAQQRKNVLLTANPDLNPNPNPNLDIFGDLRTFIDKLDISDTVVFHEIASEIVNLKTDPNDPNIEVSEETRKLLFEWTYEKVIGRPDKGSPEARYKIGSFYILDLLDKLDNLALEKFDQDFFRYISDLQHVREVMHNLNIALKFGEQYKEFVLKELSASGLHFVHNELAGVNQVEEALEKVGPSMASRKREWLSDGDWEEIYREVNFLFDSQNNPDAEVMEIDGRRLMPWEKERALRMAQVFNAGIQRRGLYSFMGDLPPMAFTPARIASTKDVYIGRSLMAGKQALQFFIGADEGTAKGSKAFLSHIVREELAEAKKNGNLFLGLFGFDEKTIIFDFYGAPDLMSQSWRLPKLFYDNIRFSEAGGGDMTLFKYLGDQIRGLDPTAYDPVLGGGSLRTEDKVILSQNVRDIILGQRLYLSTFPTYGNFDTALKTEIWKKISLLKPSTIATLLPESISDVGVWEGMRLKIFAAELGRVRADTQAYLDPQNPKTMQDLINERQNFEAIRNIAGTGAAWTAAEYNQILNYIGLGNLNLSPAEAEVLENIIKTGLSKANELAIAKIPFTFIVDDAPKMSLKPGGNSNAGIADADYIRLWASDQPTLQEGWNEGFNPMIDDPTHDPIGRFKKVVDHLARVHGRDTALRMSRPFVIAWNKFGAMDWDSKWIPGVRAYKRMTDKATSEIERHWKVSKISMNEEQTKESVLAFAQAVAMSNAELDKVRDKTGSDVPWMIVFWIRTLAALLPAAMVEEFMKIMLPKLK